MELRPQSRLLKEKDSPSFVSLRRTRIPRNGDYDPIEEAGSAADFLPPRLTLPALREAVQGCRGCQLYNNATQAAFGEGARSATVRRVGEQPGDHEDRSGRPFVGPAGRLLDRALEEAGIDRSAAYLTNTVKHFKWEARGKRRIHAKPSWSEVAACRPWLDAELAVVKPTVLVLLGAVAAQGLLGTQFRVTKQRGELVDSPLAPYVTATIHPSAILRGELADRDHALVGLVSDLRKVAEWCEPKRRSRSAGR